MSMYACDYDSIMDYQSGKNQKKALTYLWEKYRPLVISTVTRCFNKSQALYDFEDCVHDCFFHFPHVIDKQDMSKVNHRQEWSFGKAVKMYLKEYTKNNMMSCTSEMYRTTYTSEYEEDDIGAIGYAVRVPSNLTSRDNVEKAFNEISISKDVSEIACDFYNSCNSSQKLLIKICIEKNTSSDKRSMNYYVQKASKIKRGYAKKNQQTKDITKQYFYQEVNKIKRGFIQHMQQYGYFTPESLRSMGLEKLV